MPSSASRAVTRATPRLRESSDSLGRRSPSRSTPLDDRVGEALLDELGPAGAVEGREDDGARGVDAPVACGMCRGAPVRFWRGGSRSPHP